MIKLVCLGFTAPFWIARVGDWVYLFDYPSGQLLGRGIFSPAKECA